MAEQLTGYEASSVDEIEAVLDDLPADAKEVYLRTIGYSERAIAAVAAKRAGTGGGFVVGSSYATFDNSGSGNIAAGATGNVAFALNTSNGTDISLNADDHHLIDIATAGWYQVSFYAAFGGAMSEIQALIVGYPATFDLYTGAATVGGGGNLLVTMPPAIYPSDSSVGCDVYADNATHAGDYQLFAGTETLTVLRLA